jgi:phosphatidylglycerophosphate synthase
MDTPQQQEHLDGQNLQVTDKVFTLANIFSFSRILISLPIILVYYAFDGITWLFTSMVAYAIISDYLDGWAARRNNEVSELGKVVDPIADKILAGILFIFAVWEGAIPIWFLVLALSRDALILAGSLYIRHAHGKVAMSVMSGKVFVNALALYWIVAMYFPDYAGLYAFFLWGTVVLMVGSFGDYLYRFIRILQGAKFN